VKLASALLLALALLPAAQAANDKEAALRQAVQTAAPGSEAQKRAGQQLCMLTAGPLAVALWTADGQLTCGTLGRKS